MLTDRKRLLLLIGLAAVLAGVLLWIHSGPQSGGPAPAARKTSGGAAAGPTAPRRPAPQAKLDPRDALRDYRKLLELSGRQDPALLPVFKQALDSSDWRARHAAVTGIGQLGKEGDPEALASVLADRSQRPEVRAAAAEQLGAMRWCDAGPALVEAMESESVALRAAAGVALRKIMGVHYGYRADDPPDKRRDALELIRDQWPKFYAFAKRKEG